MHLKVTAISCYRLNNKLYLRINFRLEVQCNSILIYKRHGAPTAHVGLNILKNNGIIWGYKYFTLNATVLPVLNYRFDSC
jgi:hypothetical protein